MKEKAMIKETGEILEVDNHFTKSFIISSLNFDDDNKYSSKINDKLNDKFYVLSDGKEYIHSKLVIGVDNIREWKLNNII